MEHQPPPIPKPPPKQGGRLKFLFLALAPMPVALVVFTSGALQHANFGNPNTTFQALVVLSGILTFLCCVIGSIGMLGGFQGGERAKALLGGILLGMGLFVFEVSAVAFFGCVMVMAHQH